MSPPRPGGYRHHRPAPPEEAAARLAAAGTLEPDDAPADWEVGEQADDLDVTTDPEPSPAPAVGAEGMSVRYVTTLDPVETEGLEGDAAGARPFVVDFAAARIGPVVVRWVFRWSGRVDEELRSALFRAPADRLSDELSLS